MTDIVNRETRSRMMAGIGGKNTKPELALRHALHSLGARYRLHQKTLPGKPDLVFARYNAVVFIHGCFWHRHEDCKYSSQPATRVEFWAEKFRANVERDRRNQLELRNAGWRIAIVWECAIKNSASESAQQVFQWLPSNAKVLEIG